MIPSRYFRISSLFSYYRGISQSSYVCFSDSQDSNSSPNEKLKALLQSLSKVQEEKSDRVPNVQVPKARSSGRKLADSVPKKPKKSLGKEIVDAAQNIAKATVDPTKTEAELLHKLLHNDTPLANDINNLTSNREPLSKLLSSMQVKEEVPTEVRVRNDRDISRSAQVKSILPKKPSYFKKSTTSVKNIKLFSAPPLGIFPAHSEKSEQFQQEDSVILSTWHICEERERRLAVTHPPASYYEQMIHWTNKGVVWKFPINNEQGMDDEMKVSFADHVFLEAHLEDWCPESGPIRHFMELVCVGLSRNHWLKAHEKKEHILWYRDYFLDKKELLKEIGAGEISTPQESSLSP